MKIEPGTRNNSDEPINFRRGLRLGGGLCLTLAAIALWSGFGPPPSSRRTAMVKQAAFGKTPDGQAVELYTLTNAQGMEVHAMTYGGIILSLRVPDKQGRLGDVVLGYDSLEGYLAKSPYFGAIIGRYGNRIAKARFTLDGVEYQLPINNGPNSLHGGIKGFDKIVWHAEPFKNKNGVGIIFTHTSPDGDQGYPGNLTARITYTLTDQDELIFDYSATTDKPTPVNLTQHTYFNLAGEGSGDILGHTVMLNADHFTPINDQLIPTGEIRAVKGTPLDFTKPTTIGARINQKDEQLAFGQGYDHNFVLNRKGPGLVLAARATEPTSGRFLEVYTTQPGVQFYTGNFLDGTITGKSGHAYQRRSGFCLETQHYPDSPNHPNFPSTILRPGEEYKTRTIFKFGIQKSSR